MKFLLIYFGLFSIFNISQSLKCYNCNYPHFDFDDLSCEHPTQVYCQAGSVCGKVTSHQYEGNSSFSFEIKVVIKTCTIEDFCQGNEFTMNKDGVDVTKNCCNNDFCNGSEQIFYNKNILSIVLFISVLKQFS